MLNRDTPVPLYHQVKTVILREIEAGIWKPDERLPTETSLSERFHVSKITVRQALGELASLGYIRREQGRGTFVQRLPLEQGPRELTGFSEEMRRHGLVASSDVLECGAALPAADVAATLRIAPTEPVFRLRRLRRADGEPMGLQTTCLPMTLVPGIGETDFRGASLYEVLQERYSLYPATAREVHMAIALGRDDAHLLGVAPGTPGIAVERVAYLADGRPLEVAQAVMRGDRYKIVLDLVKQPTAR
jgi:GntR family transcriptional regulator